MSEPKNPLGCDALPRFYEEEGEEWVFLLGGEQTMFTGMNSGSW